MAKSHASEPWLGRGSEVGCEGAVSETVWRGLFLALSGQSTDLCPTSLHFQQRPANAPPLPVPLAPPRDTGLPVAS
eukprot:14090869-Alexandrium_andersonii.AAC.1